MFKTLGECLGECRASLKRNWRRSDVCVSIWCAFSFVGLVSTRGLLIMLINNC